MMLLHVLLLLCAFHTLIAKSRLRQFYRGVKHVNRTVAETECKTNYTDLVTVYDHQDNMELITQLINATGNPSGWIGMCRGNRSKKWSNGDDVTYNRDFKMDCSETCCAAMKADGNWEAIQCDQQRQFMCYEQDVGRASYNYSLISEKKTWFKAQLYCRENHTDLVTIRNEEENKLVKKAGKEDTPFWIGLLEDSVEWNDGGQSAYRNWNVKHLQLNQTKAYVDKQTVQWSKAEKGTYYPLCYKSFIHVSPDEMSWEEALDYCRSNINTSGLLCIESKDGQIETERELKRQKISGPVWVGLRQSRLFGFWIWYNRLHLGPWTNWKEGSAPEHQISNHCGALEKVNGQYKWCDKDCRLKFRALCEVKNDTVTHS